MSTDKPELGDLLGQVMDQARTVQGRMSEMQARISEKTVEGSAGGGIVTATANGSGRIKAIRIDPVAVDRRDVEMLEDLVVAAVNDSLRRAQEMVESELGSITGGLDLSSLAGMFGDKS
ncbi:MAG: YbaB/EbfC family nucleoid-associated protein [Rickettsiales bacterium]|nr:YbaB/EbfC family nucleoid-associated protein [Rickettsiales bacterium]|tara:strand:+ start:1155 stop:1511 length:357 start_codon:yes stop_codon:yes gene_type:complete